MMCLLGENIWINPDHVVAVEPDLVGLHQVILTMSTGDYYVVDSTEDNPTDFSDLRILADDLAAALNGERPMPRVGSIERHWSDRECAR